MFFFCYLDGHSFAKRNSINQHIRTMEPKTKKMDPKAGKFTANGHTYHIGDSLSLSRYQEYEKLQSHVGFGTDYMGIVARLKEIDQHLNKVQFSKAAVATHNLMNGLAKKADGQAHPTLMICALFINREGENAALYNEKLMEEKIEDWQKEGLGMEGFFDLAFSLMRTYNDGFSAPSPRSSAEKEGKQTTT